MCISNAADSFVRALEKRNINVYITLSKLVLWTTSVVLFGVVVGGSTAIILWHNTDLVGNVVGASQALVVVALSVLGFHSYKGSQILHVIRHLGQNNVLDSAPQQEDK